MDIEDSMQFPFELRQISYQSISCGKLWSVGHVHRENHVPQYREHRKISVTLFYSAIAQTSFCHVHDQSVAKRISQEDEPGGKKNHVEEREEICQKCQDRDQVLYFDKLNPAK